MDRAEIVAKLEEMLGAISRCWDEQVMADQQLTLEDVDTKLRALLEELD